MAEEQALRFMEFTGMQDFDGAKAYMEAFAGNLDAAVLAYMASQEEEDSAAEHSLVIDTSQCNMTVHRRRQMTWRGSSSKANMQQQADPPLNRRSGRV